MINYRQDEERALRFLERLDKMNHPCAMTDPVSALGQVAVDYKRLIVGLQDKVRQLEQARRESGSSPECELAKSVTRIYAANLQKKGARRNV